MKEKKFNVKKLISVLIILLLIPLTIWFGLKYADRHYYIVSLVIIVLTMVPFFLAFFLRAHRKTDFW